MQRMQLDSSPFACSFSKASRSPSSRRRLKWILIAATVTVICIYNEEKKQKRISSAIGWHNEELTSNVNFAKSKNSDVSIADVTKQAQVLSQAESEEEKKLYRKIKSIHILGERNSGTTWIYEHLNLCFNHTIPVRRRAKRYKHWFQDESLNTEGLIDGALIFAMFRNVYEWTEAMRNTPHHAPKHTGLEWKEFVTTPWTMERVGLDLNITNEMEPCQESFVYRDLVSCYQYPYPKGYVLKSRFSGHTPFYEMKNDGSGEPFANILEMRAAKIYNLLETQHYQLVKAFWVLRYEDLLQQGTGFLVSRLEKLTGVAATCVPSGTQNRKKRVIDAEMHAWLADHVNWEAEKLIGYTK